MHNFHMTCLSSFFHFQLLSTQMLLRKSSFQHEFVLVNFLIVISSLPAGVVQNCKLPTGKCSLTSNASESSKDVGYWKTPGESTLGKVCSPKGPVFTYIHMRIDRGTVAPTGG